MNPADKKIGRTLLALLLSAMIFLLGGCAGYVPEENHAQAVLSPTDTEYAAPEGDVPLSRGGLYTLYLPAYNGLYLAPQHVMLEAASRQDTLENLVRTLLAYPGNDEVRAFETQRPLGLYGPSPVELSGGICTVNLASSALQLNYSNFYTLSLAIAATLCELDSVESVNILVADQSVGLDTTGSLAMGSLVSHKGENLQALWGQMDAKKAPLGEMMSQVPMTSSAAVYFPLEDGQGITCENRTMSFPGQTPQQMACALLDTMSGGSMYLSGVADFPDLRSLLIHDPLVSELADGGRLIILSFREDARDTLRECGVDPACLMGAITWTLTTFIPGIAAVSLRRGEQPITQLESARFGPMAVLGGLLRRNAFEIFLTGQTTAYFARDSVLVSCKKYVDRTRVDSPREQLAALLEGPGGKDRAEGLTATLPEQIREDDILGIQAVDNTLLVNLSESFRSGIQSMGPEKEMLLCYSMVNTLCENNGMDRVCFFFEGEQVDEIAGTICWSGIFDRNNGLIEPSFG